ncbi:MAG: alpha/beta hydrolase [Anaerolineae bacterium]|nr:alpha/beta hydrolase [Anaerolineae bacterium]
MSNKLPLPTSSTDIASKIGALSGMLEIQGNQIYYQVAGQGPPIVFLHDGLVHSAGWKPSFEHFAKDYTVISYDRPGYGQSKPPAKEYSNVETLQALLQTMGVSQALFFAGSAGGMLALDFTLHDPQMVSGLLLCGPYVSGFAGTDHGFYRAWVNPFPKYYADTANNSPQDRQEVAQFWGTDPYLVAVENKGARSWMQAVFRQYPHNLEFNQVAALPDGEALGRLAQINVPVAIVIGEQDIADNHAISGAIQAGIPNATRIVVRRAAHLVYMELPEEFNQIAFQFISDNFQ